MAGSRGSFGPLNASDSIRPSTILTKLYCRQRQTRLGSIDQSHIHSANDFDTKIKLFVFYALDFLRQEEKPIMQNWYLCVCHWS
jgi:hypothetical protein